MWSAVNMNFLSEQQLALFPLSSVDDVVELIRLEMMKEDPSLALVSIVLGAVERSLTTIPTSFRQSSEEEYFQPVRRKNAIVPIPRLRLETVQVLMIKWTCIVIERVPVKDQRQSSMELLPALIKQVSDALWLSLKRNYNQDCAHIHSIYSLLTGSRLDFIGFAVAVVAACQTLSLPVSLAAAEHHFWAVHGPYHSRVHTEITWRPGDNDDKRGSLLSQEEHGRSWLHAAMTPVVCDRHMQIAVVVAALNSTVVMATADDTGVRDSQALLLIQARLLWLLYDTGHLCRHPSVLCTLASVQNALPDEFRARVDQLVILREAVLVSKTQYVDHFVLPCLQLGWELCSRRLYAEALHAWSCIGSILASSYDYGHGDEELYKELFTLVVETIPQMLKKCSSGAGTSTCVLGDVVTYSRLLMLYDGLCCWEQCSSTPVLHIAWLKAILFSIGKFEPETRSALTFTCSAHDDSSTTDSSCLIVFRSTKLSQIAPLLSSAQLKGQPISLQLTAQLQSSSAAVRSSLSAGQSSVTSRRSKR